jgi:hypothetical protein
MDGTFNVIQATIHQEAFAFAKAMMRNDSRTSEIND